MVFGKLLESLSGAKQERQKGPEGAAEQKARKLEGLVSVMAETQHEIDELEIDVADVESLLEGKGTAEEQELLAGSREQIKELKARRAELQQEADVLGAEIGAGFSSRGSEVV